MALGALASACCGPIASLYPPGGDEVGRRVWVVRHDWHTGLVVRREDVPADVWPERDDFPGAKYIEVGWGDRDFYRAPRGSLWLGLKAAFWANDSVLHIATFSAPPAVYFAGREVAEIGLSMRGFRDLAAFIADAHARTGEGRAIPLGPGRYGYSRFYLGRERYVLTTCNVWTARALRASGFPITPFWAITAANVMFQVESGLGVPAPGGGRSSALGPPRLRADLPSMRWMRAPGALPALPAVMPARPSAPSTWGIILDATPFAPGERPGRGRA